MDEEREDQGSQALSEAPRSVGEERLTALEDKTVLPDPDQKMVTAPDGMDSVIDVTRIDEEVREQEMEPRIPLWSGRKKGRRMVGKEDQPRVVLTGAQRSEMMSSCLSPFQFL